MCDDLAGALNDADKQPRREGPSQSGSVGLPGCCPECARWIASWNASSAFLSARSWGSIEEVAPGVSLTALRPFTRCAEGGGAPPWQLKRVTARSRRSTWGRFRSGPVVGFSVFDGQGICLGTQLEWRVSSPPRGKGQGTRSPVGFTMNSGTEQPPDAPVGALHDLP